MALESKPASKTAELLVSKQSTETMSDDTTVGVGISPQWEKIKISWDFFEQGAHQFLDKIKHLNLNPASIIAVPVDEFQKFRQCVQDRVLKLCMKRIAPEPIAIDKIFGIIEGMGWFIGNSTVRFWIVYLGKFVVVVGMAFIAYFDALTGELKHYKSKAKL